MIVCNFLGFLTISIIPRFINQTIKGQNLIIKVLHSGCLKTTAKVSKLIKPYLRTKPCSSAPCWRNPAKCSPLTNPPRSLPPTPPRRPWESGCTDRRLETRWRPPLPNQTWMSSSLSQTSWITLNKDSRTDLSKMLIIICQEVSSHIFYSNKNFTKLYQNFAISIILYLKDNDIAFKMI